MPLPLNRYLYSTHFWYVSARCLKAVLRSFAQREVLRIHPPISATYRTCQQDEILPLAEPVTLKSGQRVNSLRVPAKTDMLISLLGYNTSKLIFGESANEFRPQRWLDSSVNADSQWATTYSSISSFISGPRGCIGWRFAVLEIKIIIAVLVSSFRFEP